MNTLWNIKNEIKENEKSLADTIEAEIENLRDELIVNVGW